MADRLFRDFDLFIGYPQAKVGLLSFQADI